MESNYFHSLLHNLQWKEEIKEYYSNTEKAKKYYPKVIGDFEEWLKMYWNQKRDNRFKNEIICNIHDEKEFYQAIIYYISGMTDNFAIDTYNEIIGF